MKKTLEQFRAEADQCCSHMTPEERDDWAAFNAAHHPGEHHPAPALTSGEIVSSIERVSRSVEHQSQQFVALKDALTVVKLAIDHAADTTISESASHKDRADVALQSTLNEQKAIQEELKTLRSSVDALPDQLLPTKRYIGLTWLWRILVLLSLLGLSFRAHAQQSQTPPPAVATASAPTLTEGQRAFLSVDLSGVLRASSAGGSLPSGDNTIGRVKITDGTDVALVTAGGLLQVSCDAGCSGSSFADASAFTFGTTPISLMGAVVDDTSTNTVAENSAGTPRMTGSRILYFDLSKTTANATAIKVDGSAVTQPISGSVTIGTFPDNEPFNLNQIAGSAISTAATGVAKVGVVGNAGAVFDGATGAAPPANILYIGGKTSGATGGLGANMVICDSQQRISITGDTQMITGTSGRHVYICHLDLVTSAANNIAVVSGTGTVCATGINGIFGGSTAATGWNLGANGGASVGAGSNSGWVGRTNATGDNVCILRSSGAQVSGNIIYAIL